MIKSLLNKHNFALLIGAICFLSGIAVNAQNSVIYRENRATVELQWQHADAGEDGKIGVSSQKAYRDLLNGRTPTPIVVAIIDSGTETSHEDLDDALWVNPGEIPDNGIDDDGNGYIDDVHGWNFIGGKDEDVEFDNLEFTRIFSPLHKRFNQKKASDIGKSDKADYQRYLKMKRDWDNRMKKAQAELNEFNQVMQYYTISDHLIRQNLGKESYSLEEVQSIITDDEMTQAAVEFVSAVLSADLMSELDEWRRYVENQFAYSYNLDFDPRGIVGDDYSNPRERIYGNNRVSGPHADHGTHVAGIVAAEKNDFGLDGICPSCKLMIIRCVPDGDERDKDVANAIRYAVDNGARIINMSFGKSYSPQKDVVDEAVQYAERKGVLLVHAAGNDGRNTDKRDNFPRAKYNNGKVCKTWIEVGASGPEDGELVADFSNYGKKTVDLFAPGDGIFSTVTNNDYKKESGTSMASPVVAGVAGALWSYYPQLTAIEIKDILLSSGVSYAKTKVTLPGSNKVVPFGNLSRTGRVINLYAALRLAEQRAAGKK